MKRRDMLKGVVGVTTAIAITPKNVEASSPDLTQCDQETLDRIELRLDWVRDFHIDLLRKRGVNNPNEIVDWLYQKAKA